MLFYATKNPVNCFTVKFEQISKAEYVIKTLFVSSQQIVYQISVHQLHETMLCVFISNIHKIWHI